MMKIFADHCPQCNEIVEYTEEATRLQCICGHQFCVADFVSERQKMQQIIEGKDAAEKKLEETRAKRDALQAQLNNTLAALEQIEDTQTASDGKLEQLLDGMNADRQMHDAMAELLRTIQAEQTEGQDGLSKLLRVVMKEQKTADAKLDTVKALADQILAAQKGGTAARERMEDEILERIDQLDLRARERNKLGNDFCEWSQSVRKEDVERLRKLQSSSDALLQGQQKISEAIGKIDRGIQDTKEAVEKGFDEQRKWRLDEMIGRYHQATRYQARREFEKAADTYETLLSAYPEAACAEVYWRLLMCHYGVDYQKDEEKLIPIILRPDLTPMDKLDLYQDLRQAAEKEARWAYYDERLQTIDFYLQRYREVRHKPEWQFDVFISVKQNDHGRPTQDSVEAIKLYNHLGAMLASKNLRVFNSAITRLPAGEPYEPYIISALMSAKVMIVVGSKPEYLTSQWVKNEWSRFQYLQKNDKRTDRKLFCYLTGGMRAGQIPRELNPNIQAIEVGADAGDRLRAVLEAAFPSAAAPWVVQPAVPAVREPEEDIFGVMKAWLAVGEYELVTDKYSALLRDGKHIGDVCLYLYALLAKYECSDLEELAGKKLDLRNEKLLKQACKTASDKKMRAELEALLAEPAPQPITKPEPQPAPAPQVTPAPAPQPNAEQGEWQVILASYAPDKKIRIIKELRELFNYGLKEAKSIVDGCPQRIAENVTRAEAERIQRLFAGAGAETRIQAAGADSAKPAPPKQVVPAAKPEPTISLDTFDKYMAALQSEVVKRNRELTMAEIDEFISKYNLAACQIGRAEVQKDLRDIYVKLKITQKKELTETAVTEFWREWLPKVSAAAAVKPHLTETEANAAKNAVGIWTAAYAKALGVICINHGMFRGNTAVVIAKDKMYINVNNKTACPPAEMQYRDLQKAEVGPMVKGKRRLILKLKTGEKSFVSPAVLDRDALNFSALADALNQFIKEFNLKE